MDPTDLDSSLVEMFNTSMTWSHNQAALELPTNEEEPHDTIPLTLLIKPFGFKTPHPKAIIPRLLQAWNTKNGVTIALKKYAEDLLVCLFKDKRDLKYVERERACLPSLTNDGDNREARWRIPTKGQLILTFGSSIGGDEDDFLRQSHLETPHLTGPSREAMQGAEIFTDILYLGYVEEQTQVAAQFQPRPIPTRSLARPKLTEGRSLNLHGGSAPFPSPGKLSLSTNRINPHICLGKSKTNEENSRINIRQRKRKIDISMDAMQEDWNAYSSQLWEPALSSMEFQFSLMPELDYVATEVEQESPPEEIQMAEEAGLIKPPMKP
ncbi:hypothetical protein CRG98_029675 [Punica granatum]|uniref:Uncharacterized protein n=1 Tax=Punica granatum TaxID=22663 RepID=A0A2I0J1M8_PUNGR|nr:hypothetical protein CRG98_029675 [Punica granatum]